jgi:prepilin-type N-terminal cleavage/methylation domain-containing protein
MRATKKSIHRRRELAIAVDWQDDVWQPRIEMLPEASRRAAKNSDSWLPAVTGRVAPVCCNDLFFKPMQSILPGSHRHRAGFTLVELLTVIAIIGVLAAMVLTAMAGVRNKAKKVKAQLEMSQLVLAIQHYDSTYGRFPVSDAAQAAANANANPPNPAQQNGDFTFGGIIGGISVFTPNYQVTNDQVVAILMNLTNYPNTSNPTVNTNYMKNPQQQIFLNAKMSGWNPSTGGQPEPGVGTDLVYRDPWGNPYIITMDLNYDEICEDAFYKSTTVAAGGLNGLVQAPDGNYADRGKVMVWSAGPDGKIDSGVAGNQGVNKDNVLSWK